MTGKLKTEVVRPWPCCVQRYSLYTSAESPNAHHARRLATPMVQVYRGDALTDGSFLKAFKEEQQLKDEKERKCSVRYAPAGLQSTSILRFVAHTA